MKELTGEKEELFENMLETEEIPGLNFNIERELKSEFRWNNERYGGGSTGDRFRIGGWNWRLSCQEDSQRKSTKWQTGHLQGKN